MDAVVQAELDKQSYTSSEWRLSADKHLSVAELLAASMRPIPTEVIALHCQQAVEKYLKGALVILGIDIPNGYDLDVLCSMAEKCRPSFVSISTLFTIITQFSVQYYYNVKLCLSEDDMNIVLTHTHTIKEFLKKEVPELFEGL